ncbi:MAG: hypothetical protein R3B70_02365 [Polyangiaceae bacterium]
MIAEPHLYRAGALLVSFRRGSPGGVPASEAEAHAGQVASWFEGDDPFAREFLLDLLDLLGENADRGYALSTGQLIGVVAEAVLEGELRVETFAEGFRLFAAEEKLAEREREQGPRRETTWVGIRLVNKKGEPVPYKRYRVELPDGSVREGLLDAEGVARIDGIEAGSCKVSFPALDARLWRKK